MLLIDALRRFWGTITGQRMMKLLTELEESTRASRQALESEERGQRRRLRGTRR